MSVVLCKHDGCNMPLPAWKANFPYCDEHKHEVVQEHLAEAYLALDIRALIEEHGNILLPGGDSKRQLNGQCPWNKIGECTAKENGFIVWPILSDRGKHYHCRQCRKSGTILDLVQQLHKTTFREACELLNIPNPYCDDGVWSAPNPLDRNTNIPAIDPYRLEQLALLHTWYPRAKTAVSRDRARTYLAQRGIAFDLAESAGLGYIPAIEGMTVVTPEVEKLRRWGDRIIFPIHTTSGELCYAGRSLFLWEPGMDEDEHKDLIDAYNAKMKSEHGDQAGCYLVPRWLYTHLRGFYNWPIVASAESLILVEGPFDVLACMAAGLDNAISIGTAGINADAIPLQIDQVTMGLDIDGPGRNAAKQLAKMLRRKGIQVELASPIFGKDWSEAYRLHGLAGLAPLLPQPPEDLVTASDENDTGYCTSCLDEDKVTEVIYSAENTFDEVLYCPAHHPGRVVEQPIVDPSRQLTTQELVSRLTDALADWSIEVHPGPAILPERVYVPCLLPELPRKTCLHHVQFFTNHRNGQSDVKWKVCNLPATYGGWCSEHRGSATWLDIGAKLAYPRVQLNEFVTIGIGVGNWEEHAEKRMARNLVRDIAVVRSLLEMQERGITLPIIVAEPLPGPVTQAYRGVIEEYEDRPFGDVIEEILVAPPRHHVAKLDAHKKPIRSAQGNIIFEVGDPMMSAEEWAKIRTRQLEWRPDPALMEHRRF